MNPRSGVGVVRIRLLTSDHWVMDESGYERVVVLRRTPTPSLRPRRSFARPKR